MSRYQTEEQRSTATIKRIDVIMMVAIGSNAEDLRIVKPLATAMFLGDQAAAAVLNDWCLEREIEGGSARIHWLMSAPTEFQSSITLAVLNRSTTEENWPRLVMMQGPYYQSVFREAKRQLLIHKHAPYARVVKAQSYASVQRDEVLIDLIWRPMNRRRPTTHHRLTEWRCRCNAAGCVPLSIGQAKPASNQAEIVFRAQPTTEEK